MPKSKKDSSSEIAKMAGIHEQLKEQTDRLNTVLINLRYEGKTNLGKNLKEVWGILFFFEKEVCLHVEAEEKLLFPFLQAHVPRLEPLINLFHSEHEDFKRNLKRFRLAMEELCGENGDHHRAKRIDNVREIGTYLIYLLRQHMAAEEESIYKAVLHELHQGEREELEKLIASHRASKAA
ncbi:MAG: hemerythrin domain-containing protein [Candidatus Omnitrophica bacterium]|nr:hemerythrin domain-containing protein [Candidatus Omnitrophota bacterium]